MKLLLLLVLALVAPAAAEGCVPSATEPDVCWQLVGVCASGDIAGLLYVDVDRCWQDECLSLWIYAESNGMAGLQRADEVVDDTCGGPIPADRMVF